MNIKPLEKLTIKDNFMFVAAMTEDPENCRGCIERALGIQIERVEVSREKNYIYNPKYKGIRMDVYAQDENHTHYDVEMQVARERAIEKRSRYYHSQMDMDLLLTGKPYEELPDVYVIFICDYDPFGLGKYRYTVKEIFEEDENSTYVDGRHTIFLSTKGKNDDEVPQELVSFLQYIGLSDEDSERTFEDTYIKRLQETVQKIKDSREMGAMYMTIEEYFRRKLEEENKEAFERAYKEACAKGHAEGHAKGHAEGHAAGVAEGIVEGRAKGRAEGRAEEHAAGVAEGIEENILSLVKKKLAKGKPIEQIADEVEESVERVRKLIEKLESDSKISDAKF